MITLRIKNPSLPEEVVFPIREKDIGFLNAVDLSEEDKKKVPFLARRKIKPYRQDNADYFWEYADSVYKQFISVFTLKSDKEFEKKIKHRFVMLMLFRDNRLQKMFNSEYASKKDFLEKLKHTFERYCYPMEDFQHPNPLPTVITSSLFSTLYFYITHNGEMDIPDSMIPFLLPAMKGDTIEEEAENRN